MRTRFLRLMILRVDSSSSLREERCSGLNPCMAQSCDTRATRALWRPRTPTLLSKAVKPLSATTSSTLTSNSILLMEIRLRSLTTSIMIPVRCPLLTMNASILWISIASQRNQWLSSIGRSPLHRPSLWSKTNSLTSTRLSPPHISPLETSTKSTMKKRSSPRSFRSQRLLKKCHKLWRKLREVGKVQVILLRQSRKRR